MIFRLYAVYNKHETLKIGNQTREKYQVLSQVLEYFLLSTVYHKCTWKAREVTIYHLNLIKPYG